VEKYLHIGKSNLKHNLLPHLTIATLFLCLTPFLMGISYLDTPNTARILEMYVALLGIILLTPIYLPEQNKEIRELVEAKFTSSIIVIIIRVLEAMLCMIILIGVYIILLKNNHCSFPEMKFYLGTLGEAVFLGGMGFFVYSIFDQIAVAYMLPLVYYMINYSGRKYLKDFFLFSMSYEGYREKVYLAIVGLVLIVLGICYPYISKRALPRLMWH
jgi:hypothetical protein